MEVWRRALESGDDARIADAAELVTRPVPAEWRFTRCDAYWRPQAAITGDIIDASGSDVRNRAGDMRMTLTGDSVHTPELMRCQQTLVGIKMETAGLRLAYWLRTHHYELANGTITNVVEAQHIWSVLNYMTVWPSWQLPLQVQPISHAVYAGGIVTVIETMIAETATRIQLGWQELASNALSGNPDLRAWLGTLRTSDGNIRTMLKKPLYVVRSNPFLDSSPSVVRLVKMESCGEVATDLTGPYGIDVSMDLWEPGDEQPDRWANLDCPTYVVRVRDRSQIEGPTRTVLDTAIKDTVDLVGSAFGEAVAPLITRAPSGYVAPRLGVNYVEPWAIVELPEGGSRGSVVSGRVSHHAHDGWRHVIGGKSPAWLNSMINSWLSWLVDSVTIVIGLIGVPSNLLDGFLNDAFYAFQMVDNYDRRVAGGPYHPAKERFHATQASGYSITATINFIKALYESRPYASAQVVCRSGPGEVLTLGRDIFKSSLLSVVYFGRRRMVTDFVEAIMWRFAADERTVMYQVGDGRDEEPPIAKHARRLADLERARNVLTLAPRSS